MPNIKSAIKRVSVIEHKTLRNKMVKSATKTAIKKFDAATASKTATAEMLSSASSAVRMLRTVKRRAWPVSWPRPSKFISVFLPSHSGGFFCYSPFFRKKKLSSLNETFQDTII